MFRRSSNINWLCKAVLRATPKAMYRGVTVGEINPNIKRLEYAVRGPIVTRSLELQKEISQSDNKPFNKIIRCNIGDCHASGQKPISFIRDTLSVATNPKLFDSTSIPEDAKMRAKRFLDSCGGSLGVYSQSTGVEIVRQDIANYISNRDGIPANPQNIFITSGASEAVKYVLHLLSTGDSKMRTGVMIPIPQYPLYSATIDEFNLYQINYYLDESNGWDLQLNELESALSKHKNECIPRVLVVINPGNPTGQLLHQKSITDVLNFAYKHNLIVMADEVYQHNVYASDRQFVSFKRALHDIGGHMAGSLQLASFMSCSKGYMGECGMRGGYCELINFDPEVQDHLYKSLSARLCSPLSGQLTMDIVVNPPHPNEPSYDRFMKEKKEILDELKEKANLLTDTLNSLPGYSCNAITGAMYAFPRIDLPPKFIELAKSKGMEPDFLYCLNFLEEYGVCLVPGSGFGQTPGTYHFRITILPSVEDMKFVVRNIEQYHMKVLKNYS